MKQKLLPLVFLLTLAACSTTGPETIKPADVLYRDARESVELGNYQRAEDELKTVLSHYPFTEFAVQAQLDLLYVLMQLNDPEALDEEAERFIRENPRHPEIDYVYYMKGIAYYRNERNPLEEIADIDMATRAAGDAETAFRNFSQLVARYPDSEYAADARLRMVELRNFIARHEMLVASFYMKQGAWISAIHRAERVLREFQGTPAETDALMVLERGYEQLGLDDLAETPRRILAENPDRKPVVFKQD